MNTFEIAASALEGYKNTKLSDERINTLIKQANTQIEEIAQNSEIYNNFLEIVNAPKNIDNIILWILFMSNEDICSDYIDEFDKDYSDNIPVSDLADLLLHVAHSKIVKNVELPGYDYLVKYKNEGLKDADQYAFTNVLVYIQKSKEIEIQF